MACCTEQDARGNKTLSSGKLGNCVEKTLKLACWHSKMPCEPVAQRRKYVQHFRESRLISFHKRSRYACAFCIQGLDV
jgi:hypothetical protein